MRPTNTRVKCVLVRLLAIVSPAFVLLPLTYVVPYLNPFSLPHLDLTDPLALAAYWVAESGGKFGIPAIAALMIACLVGRSGLSWRQRTVEVLAIVLVIAIFLGGGAYLNEHVVKPAFHVPRPNIIELATAPADSPALKISVEEFYNLPDKISRSAYLASILGAPDFDSVPLPERIREHWISETGYSFPSGHSFSSLMFATFFLAMGLTFCSGRRLWVFYFLVPWAVAVCYSRTILRVHSPTDISIGGFQGIVVGILAFLLVHRILVLGGREETTSRRLAIPMAMTKKPTAVVTETPVRSVGSIVLGAFSICLCVVAEAAVLASRRRFSRFIEEFELDVSFLTQFAIGPIFPVLLAVIIVAAVVKEFVPASQLWLDKCNAVVLFLGAASFATYIVGISAPLMSLIESLSS